METTKVTVTRTDATELSIELRPGEVMYMLGANGVGKSSLVSRIYRENTARAKRISAHRQTWFTNNTISMTPRAREDVSVYIRGEDIQAHSRFRLSYGEERASIAIYDLINAQALLDRNVASLVRDGKVGEAKKAGKIVPPISVMNGLLAQSNIPIKISVTEQDKLVASKNGSPNYSVAELSDGERNALLIIADVLTSKPGQLLIIDEPERHLHRSIISPLLSSLFAQRKDCVFIVSTHEVMLPIDMPNAKTLLVRGCEYQDGDIVSWTADLLNPGVGIDDDLKADILGARRKIVFIEGGPTSLDTRLYSLLFPGVTVIPKEGWKEVENAVVGLRSVADLNWISPWGIVDRDQRTVEQVERLRGMNIYALSHYSIEALYYLDFVVEAVASRQAAVQGFRAAAAKNKAIRSALDAIREKRDEFVLRSTERKVRDLIQSQTPDRTQLTGRQEIRIEVDIAKIRLGEQVDFDRLVDADDWEGLLRNHKMRSSGARARVAEALRFASYSDYENAVLTLVADDAGLSTRLRNLFGDLYPRLTGLATDGSPAPADAGKSSNLAGSVSAQ